MKSTQEDYNKLCYYTLSRQSPSFIHQHIVDAFAAQNADELTKPITLTFALIGLYLHIEKGYTGREVQKAHMRLARHRKQLSLFNLPEERGNITAKDVINVPEGNKRDKMIDNWCISVWKAYHESHKKIEALVQKELYKKLI